MAAPPPLRSLAADDHHGKRDGVIGSMLPGGPPPVNVHVVPAASAFCKSADEGVATSGTSTPMLVPTTRSAPCEGPAFVRMTEPSPLQVALNSNAVGPAIGSADTPPATMSETAPAATIVTIKRFSPGKGGARLTANAQSSRARSLSQRCGPPQLVRDELWTLRDQCFESFAHLDLR